MRIQTREKYAVTTLLEYQQWIKKMKMCGTKSVFFSGMITKTLHEDNKAMYLSG